MNRVLLGTAASRAGVDCVCGLSFRADPRSYVFMIRTISILFLLSSLALSAKTLEDVITQAREFVGPNEKIESIDTLLYEGVLVPENGAEERRISLLLKKPASQRLEITQGESRITMVVNDMEGFMMQENLVNGQKGFSPLPTDQVRRFKANAAENLYFFKFPSSVRVRSKYLGEQEFRGQPVDAVRFIHSGGVQFFRYFDPETGELLGTETDTGTINTEEGAIQVDGLRFSDKVLSFEGDELAHTITFDKIEVNPEVPEGAFTFPE
ncbi:hypothetical protein [Puniceicoccus vermicola]|uniref:Outer membrane lipoprotein carrier protein LolA n=1 Tax=Puniceicoccus vermicola TaxID=388746 RepID=A0A7X1E538_9BACT|nr:hypothetical protein [Puniceicoccus vermicola]MBC2601222.1 hypothetical protein [Puniceicoccus vermicola]